jgi:hypothetical protein
MPRSKIAVTNYDKTGKVTPGLWYVRYGNKWETFDEARWEAEGIAWLHRRITSKGSV